MKISLTLITFILFLLSITSKAQTVFTKETLPDTVLILTQKDDMTGATNYFTSKSMICGNEGQTIGFVLHPFIESNLSIKDLYVKMVNIGNCVEHNEMIILFVDDTKFTGTSWNDFDCEGDAFFKVGKKDIEQLSAKKIKKIRVTNGRTFESFTKEIDVEDQDYFIRLFKMLKLNQVYTYKGK